MSDPCPEPPNPVKGIYRGIIAINNKVNAQGTGFPSYREKSRPEFSAEPGASIPLQAGVL
jgi:hypothetical protein